MGSGKDSMPPHQRTTLLDDGSPGSDAWIPKTPWHELRTVIGKEGPVEAPVASLRDPRRLGRALPVRAAFDERLRRRRVRTKLLLAQARNLERTASYDEEEEDDDDDDELDALLVSCGGPAL